MMFKEASNFNLFSDNVSDIIFGVMAVSIFLFIAIYYFENH